MDQEGFFATFSHIIFINLLDILIQIDLQMMTVSADCVEFKSLFFYCGTMSMDDGH